jgi:hypothetical protein
MTTHTTTRLLTLLATADRIGAAQERAYHQWLTAYERGDAPAMTRWLNTIHRLNHLALRNADRISALFNEAA